MKKLILLLTFLVTLSVSAQVINLSYTTCGNSAFRFNTVVWTVSNEENIKGYYLYNQTEFLIYVEVGFAFPMGNAYEIMDQSKYARHGISHYRLEVESHDGGIDYVFAKPKIHTTFPNFLKFKPR